MKQAPPAQSGRVREASRTQSGDNGGEQQKVSSRLARGERPGQRGEGHARQTQGRGRTCFTA